MARRWSGRLPRLHRIDRAVRLAAPLEDVFAFFADAANLELLTPAWLHFRILSPLPLAMGVGTPHRLPPAAAWGCRSAGRARSPPGSRPWRFVDEQRRGPYRVWIHEHRFTVEQQGRTGAGGGGQ